LEITDGSRRLNHKLTHPARRASLSRR